MGNNQQLPSRPQFRAPPPTEISPLHFPADRSPVGQLSAIGQRRSYAQFAAPSPLPTGTSPQFPNPTLTDSKLQQTFGKPKERTGIFREEQKVPTVDINQGMGMTIKVGPREDSAQGYREAVQMVDEFLLLDEKYATLENELLLEPKDGMYQYRGKEMYRLASVSIPGIVTSMYQTKRDDLQCCLSGIWPEIKRVYITIDNRLFLWHYQNTADVSSFEPTTLPIEAICLSKPAPELARILPPGVPYALWIATESEIRLFGLEVSPSLNLIGTDFSISPEGDKLNKIVTTATGRVFYGGSEGKLTEINYNEPLSWFTKKGKMAKQDRSGSWLGGLIPAFFTFTGKYSIEDICVDDSRHALYVLQKRVKSTGAVESMITVYDLGGYGTDFAETCKISQPEILSKAALEDERIRNDDTASLLSIIPIEKAYSETIQLLLVFSNGLRIYLTFDTERRSLDHEKSPPKMRGTYRIAAIKFPPQTVAPVSSDLDIGGFLGSPEGIHRLDKVFRSRDNRTLVLADFKTEKVSSVLLTISSNEPELGYIRNSPPSASARQLKQIVSCIETGTNGPITEIAEDVLQNRVDQSVVELMGISETGGTRRQAYPVWCMHGTARSVYLPAAEYYVLTSNELATYVKPRAVDWLVQALFSDNPVTTTAAMESVVGRYGKVETCAMLLHVLCSPTEGYYVEVPEPGGLRRPILTADSRSTQPSSSVHIVKLDKKMRDRAKKYFFDLGNTISLEDDFRRGEFRTRFLDTYGMATGKSTNIHSAKLSALYLYLSRIIRPIWDQTVTRSWEYTAESVVEQEGMWNEKQRRTVQYKLFELRQFVDENMEFMWDLQPDTVSVPPHHPLNAPGLTVGMLSDPGLQPLGNEYTKVQSEKLENLIGRERKHIENLQRLLVKMGEGLELLSFMDDQEAFRKIQEHLSVESQRELAGTVFKHVLYQQLSNDFLTTLIMHYLNVKKSQGTDSLKLANEIYNKCSGFFTLAHLNVYKAEVLLEKAGRMVENKSAQTNTIKEATGFLFDNLPQVEIERVVPLLAELGQFSLAKKLCLAVAAEQDRLLDGEGTLFSPQADLYKRTCYSYIIDMLDELHSCIISKSPAFKGTQLAPSKGLFAPLFAQYTLDQLLELEDGLLTEAVAETQDETFHLTLFRWLSEKQLLDKVIKLKSPFLEQFIKNRFEDPAVAGAAATSSNEFLYKYFLAKGAYRKAAEVLYGMATSGYAENAEGGAVTLEDRVQYLNVAIDCIDRMIAEGGTKPVQELADYKYSIEVCKDAIRLQTATVNALKEIAKKTIEPEFRQAVEEGIGELEYSLIDPADLYERYAKRFELWDLAIKILAGQLRDTPSGPLLDELPKNYANLLWRIFAVNPSEWPSTVIPKLTELAQLFYWNQSPMMESEPAARFSPDFARGKSRPGFFPVDAVASEAERINMKRFDMTDFPIEGESAEILTDRPEFWMVNFLRGDAVRMRSEEVFEVYQRLEEEDPDNLKWGVRIGLAKMVICILWAREVSQGTGIEKCRDASKRSIKAVQKKLKMAGRTVPVYVEEYVRGVIGKLNEAIRPGVGPVQEQKVVPTPTESSFSAGRRKSVPPTRERKNKADLVKEFQQSVKMPSPQ